MISSTRGLDPSDQHRLQPDKTLLGSAQARSKDHDSEKGLLWVAL